jgi:outer membrane protein assembly factor BamA
LIYFKRHLPRTSFGFRAQTEYIRSVGNQPCFENPTQQCPKNLPIFERLTLGGEYSIRGLDLRSVGPTVPFSQAVLGGNKSLLFNAEYLISIASQVRFVLFYDAGQVRNVGQSFAWKEDLTQLVFPPQPPLVDSLTLSSLTPIDAPGVTTQVIGKTSAFKTSTGVELRFFMPVLNVPFRLIYAACRRARQQLAAAEGSDLQVCCWNDVLGDNALGDTVLRDTVLSDTVQKCVTLMV